jgi:hypothetical protein
MSEHFLCKVMRMAKAIRDRIPGICDPEWDHHYQQLSELHDLALEGQPIPQQGVWYVRHVLMEVERV